MVGCPYTIDEALPHARPMILLDEVLDWDTEKIRTCVTIHPSQPFFRAEGMPVHVAIEYMAQACGAYVGVEALNAGRAPRVGLLLGTRNFVASKKWIDDGTRLLVSANIVYREGQMGVFDCRVDNDANCDTLASARLTVYQPSSQSAIRSSHG